MRAARIAADPRYAALVRDRQRFSWTLTAITVIVYSAVISLIAFDKPLMAWPMGGTVSLAVVLGAAMLIGTVAIPAVYVRRQWRVRHAAGRDPSVRRDAHVSFSFENPLTRQRGYWQLNGVVSLNGGRDKPWKLALIGRNLANRLVVVAGSVVGATARGTGTATVVPGDILGGASTPRSILLQLTLKSSLLRR